MELQLEPQLELHRTQSLQTQTQLSSVATTIWAPLQLHKHTQTASHTHSLAPFFLVKQTRFRFILAPGIFPPFFSPNCPVRTRETVVEARRLAAEVKVEVEVKGWRVDVGAQMQSSGQQENMGALLRSCSLGSDA